LKYIVFYTYAPANMPVRALTDFIEKEFDFPPRTWGEMQPLYAEIKFKHKGCTSNMIYAITPAHKVRSYTKRPKCNISVVATRGRDCVGSLERRAS